MVNYRRNPFLADKTAFDAKVRVEIFQMNNSKGIIQLTEMPMYSDIPSERPQIRNFITNDVYNEVVFTESPIADHFCVDYIPDPNKNDVKNCEGTGRININVAQGTWIIVKYKGLGRINFSKNRNLGGLEKISYAYGLPFDSSNASGDVAINKKYPNWQEAVTKETALWGGNNVNITSVLKPISGYHSKAYNRVITFSEIYTAHPSIPANPPLPATPAYTNNQFFLHSKPLNPIESFSFVYPTNANTPASMTPATDRITWALTGNYIRNLNKKVYFYMVDGDARLRILWRKATGDMQIMLTGSVVSSFSGTNNFSSLTDNHPLKEFDNMGFLELGPFIYAFETISPGTTKSVRITKNTDTKVDLQNMNVNWKGGCAIYDGNGGIWLLGNEYDTSVFTNTYRYNIWDNTWSLGPNLPLSIGGEAYQILNNGAVLSYDGEGFVILARRVNSTRTEISSSDPGMSPFYFAFNSQFDNVEEIPINNAIRTPSTHTKGTQTRDYLGQALTIDGDIYAITGTYYLRISKKV